MSVTLGILDTDIKYANRLMEYLKRNKRVLAQVRVFSNLDNLYGYLDKYKLDILLLSEDLFPLQGRSMNNLKIILLGESKGNEVQGYSIVSKYQSVKNLLQELMDLCPSLGNACRQVDKKSEVSIHTIFSLGSEEVGEVFSYLLAQEYAKIESTVYINLECFTGLKEFKTNINQKGISDIIYFLNEKVENFQDKFEGIIQNRDNLFFIPVTSFCSDLYELTVEGIKTLLDTLKSCKRFKHCIINVGFITPAILSLLEQSMKIYIVEEQNSLVKSKVETFYKQLKWAGFDSILEKCREIELSSKDKKELLIAYDQENFEQEESKFIRKFI